MTLPVPLPGLVVRYAYLWHSEHERGLEEGAKIRPAAVLLSVASTAGRQTVTVLPITHSPPRTSDEAVEIPAATKRRLGLDDERSWIVLTEANRFLWPGPDLRPSRAGDRASVAYGQLPGDLFRQVRDRWLALSTSRRNAIVPRTD